MCIFFCDTSSSVKTKKKNAFGLTIWFTLLCRDLKFVVIHVFFFRQICNSKLQNSQNNGFFQVWVGWGVEKRIIGLRCSWFMPWRKVSMRKYKQTVLACSPVQHSSGQRSGSSSRLDGRQLYWDFRKYFQKGIYYTNSTAVLKVKGDHLQEIARFARLYATYFYLDQLEL